MSPTVKYTLARAGLFLAVFLVLWPLRLNIFVTLMIAVLASAGLALVLLRPWRDQMAQQLADAAQRRRGEKERLRAALAGDDEPLRPEPIDGPEPIDRPGPGDGHDRPDGDEPDRLR